ELDGDIAQPRPDEVLARATGDELRAFDKLVLPRTADFESQACIVQPSTPMAAWRSASERVGCGWQVRATSSEAARNSIATQYSAIISPTCGPIMWTPRTSSVLASARTFTKPSVS